MVTGLGRVAAVALALHGFHVFLVCRDAGETAEVLNEISQRSVGTAQAEFIALAQALWTASERWTEG